jgi:hypothetical protein
MNVVYDEKIKQDPALLELAERGTDVLEEMIRPNRELLEMSEDRPFVAWGLSQDEQGELLMTLTITDGEESATGRFTRKQMADADRQWFLVRRVWGDVLGDRLRKGIKRTQELVRALDEE